VGLGGREGGGWREGGKEGGREGGRQAVRAGKRAAAECGGLPLSFPRSLSSPLYLPLSLPPVPPSLLLPHSRAPLEAFIRLAHVNTTRAAAAPDARAALRTLQEYLANLKIAPSSEYVSRVALLRAAEPAGAGGGGDEGPGSGLVSWSLVRDFEFVDAQAGAADASAVQAGKAGGTGGTGQPESAAVAGRSGASGSWAPRAGGLGLGAYAVGRGAGGAGVSGEGMGRGWQVSGAAAAAGEVLPVVGVGVDREGKPGFYCFGKREGYVKIEQGFVVVYHAFLVRDTLKSRRFSWDAARKVWRLPLNQALRALQVACAHTPCVLHPTPYTLNATPCPLDPTPYTLTLTVHRHGMSHIHARVHEHDLF